MNEQLSIFDFDFGEQQPPAPAKPKPKRSYPLGATFQKNGLTVSIKRKCFKDTLLESFKNILPEYYKRMEGKYDWWTDLICFEKNGYRMEVDGILNYDRKTGEPIIPIPEDARIIFPAMSFDFFKGEKSLNGDGYTNIPWLKDKKIVRLVREAFPKQPIADRICYSNEYDFRDLFVMKWLGLERLPNKYFDRVKGQTTKKYYDIDITLGELLKFLGMEETK